MSRTGANTSGIGHDARPPLDPLNMSDDASEYSWGAALTPPSLEHAPPSEGGRYRGITPEPGRHIGVGR